ncbi:MAG: ImmA/IrrE family metallo-endopeptidase [Rhodothermaceae bacterium]
MSDKAFITPEVLKWARETAKFSIPEIAHKMKVQVSQIENWEAGVEYPTISQAENLSKRYKRALAVFFLPEPPTDFETLRDFRRKDLQGEFSTALTFILREIQIKQSWMTETLEEEGEVKLDFIGKFSIKNSTEDVANNIKEVLGIGSFPRDRDILKSWIEKVEKKRIFVCLASQIHSHLKLDRNEVRGFAISNKLAPFIFINSSDPKNAQLFTLVHELAHLWINSSGVSNINSIDFRRSEKENFDDAEVFCNEVTANILMPEKLVLDEIKKNDGEVNVSEVERIAKTFQVSSFAMCVRLLNLGKIDIQKFNQIKEILEKNYNDYLKKEEKKKRQDLPVYYPVTIRRNSRSFTSYIYNMYRGGVISGSDACGLLNMKINTIKKLGNHLQA